jgi:uncharacterized lipoprotein YmbA
MTPHRPARGRAAGLLAIALLAGCFGKSPLPHFYTLSPAGGPAAGTPLAERPELGLSVGPIEIPRYVDRPELVTRQGVHGLVPWNDHRWGGSLRTDLLRAVASDLGSLLGTLRVAVYPAEARFPVHYRVLIDFVSLDGEAGRSVLLRAVWTLASGQDGRALLVQESSFEEPVGSPGFEDLVAAQRSALARLDREIAARIAALPAH